MYVYVCVCVCRRLSRWRARFLPTCAHIPFLCSALTIPPVVRIVFSNASCPRVRVRVRVCSCSCSCSVLTQTTLGFVPGTWRPRAAPRMSSSCLTCPAAWRSMTGLPSPRRAQQPCSIRCESSAPTHNFNLCAHCCNLCIYTSYVHSSHLFLYVAGKRY